MPISTKRKNFSSEKCIWASNYHNNDRIVEMLFFVLSWYDYELKNNKDTKIQKRSIQLNMFYKYWSDMI